VQVLCCAQLCAGCLLVGKEGSKKIKLLLPLKKQQSMRYLFHNLLEYLRFLVFSYIMQKNGFCSTSGTSLRQDEKVFMYRELTENGYTVN